jgi:hypothetical protein
VGIYLHLGCIPTFYPQPNPSAGGPQDGRLATVPNTGAIAPALLDLLYPKGIVTLDESRGRSQHGDEDLGPAL